MGSLRARLIAGLLLLAAAGLVVLAAVTYTEQRSFLLTRIDGQVRSAIPLVGRALTENGVPGGPRRRFGGDGDGGPPPFGGHEGGAAASLPPGTYGQRRSVTGKVLGAVSIAYGSGVATPRLPAHLVLGRLMTLTSADDVRYRVLSVPDPLRADTTVVAVPLREVDQTLGRLLKVEALVVALVLLVLGAVSWWLVRLGLRPLDRMGETAGAIAGGDLDRRVEPADPHTEVGRLGLALNAMLARLEHAFGERQASEDRLRRFLSDASHELRTPLAAIRGYAELFRIGAAADEADVRRSMQRIEQEAARMGVLVEDLLTLARLDEVRDPVREEVDLAALTRDAVDDARATAPDREIDVHAASGTSVLGDPGALRQVLGNLVRNALVHTPPGTPVEVTLRRDGKRAELEVRDHGPGLPTDDADQLFERFWRAEGGRERGRAGAGLGLAIVAGIVRAHGGEVHAGNAESGGARFVVSLPALRAAPAARPHLSVS